MDKATLIQGIIDRNEYITKAVFFSTDSEVSCKALLCRKLVDFNYIPPEAYYNMLVSDLYSIFMNLNKEGDEMGNAKNLKAIKNPDAFFGWIEIAVVRHLTALKKKTRESVICC